MKRIVFTLALIFMVSVAAGVFAQDPVQPDIQAPQETKTEAKKADKAKNGTVPFTMGEIVVRDRAVPNIEDASTTTEISGKDIENRSDRSLADTLTMVPGVIVEQTNKGFYGLSMRGFDHDKVAILIDGIPVLDPYYGGNNIDISTIPVSNVSRIIVNRGATSALYGALGATGSINIITKKPEQLTAAGKVEYGAYQNYSIDAEAGAPIGNFYAWITASIQNSDGYEISKKLDASTRKSWFDKLVSYQQYGIDYSTITMYSKFNYLNDSNGWNNTSYRKYSSNARVGYNINKDIETGVSVSWYSNEIQSNTFQDNSIATFGYYDKKAKVYKNDWSVSTVVDSDKKASIFTNRAFNWPEDTRLTVAPYFRADFEKLKIKFNAFYIAQRNNLEGYFDQNQNAATWMFPSSTGFAGQIQSIYEESSYGFNLLPTYQMFSWNKLSAAIHFRIEKHEKNEKALDSTSVFATTLGTGEVQVQELQASYLTVALEDQAHFNTPIGLLILTAGISYDAQNFNTFKYYDSSTFSLQDGILLDDDNYVWGTRDSFSPVIAAVYDPIKDFLRLRTAFAIKTNFPNLSTYNDIGSAMLTMPTADLGIEPERIYSYNGGFELMFLNNTINLRTDYFYTLIKNKIERIYDPNQDTDLYTNIDGIVIQGLENTLQSHFTSLFGIMDLDGSLSYIFSHARNDDTSRVTMGEDVVGVPQHQFIAQLIFNFITNTRMIIWGNYTLNQIKYVMASDPRTTSPGIFTTDVYTTRELHNPFMLHVKVQQELPFNMYVYAMCKNVLDDYNADPFNPGPGRMFYFGGGGRL